LFFTATASPVIYTLSLHDALPIFEDGVGNRVVATDRDGQHARLDDLADMRLDVGMALFQPVAAREGDVANIGDLELEDWRAVEQDRKSTRLNSSHVKISYAVFCLK